MSEGQGPFKKFYPIIGRELGIALEATFYLDPSFRAELPDDPRYKFLVYYDPAKFLTRFYFPATVGGEIGTPKGQNISFVPWIDRSQAAFHRICLRARKDNRTRSFNWLSLARMSEDTDFGFTPIYDKGEAYISLDFFSKRSNVFLPVFVRAKKQDGEDYDYFVIEAEEKPEEADKEIVLTVRTVEASQVPPPWISLE